LESGNWRGGTGPMGHIGPTLSLVRGAGP
jgi:hypothetical protein